MRLARKPLINTQCVGDEFYLSQLAHTRHRSSRLTPVGSLLWGWLGAAHWNLALAGPMGWTESEISASHGGFVNVAIAHEDVKSQPVTKMMSSNLRS